MTLSSTATRSLPTSATAESRRAQPPPRVRRCCWPACAPAAAAAAAAGVGCVRRAWLAAARHGSTGACLDRCRSGMRSSHLERSGRSRWAWAAPPCRRVFSGSAVQGACCPCSVPRAAAGHGEGGRGGIPSEKEAEQRSCCVVAGAGGPHHSGRRDARPAAPQGRDAAGGLQQRAVPSRQRRGGQDRLAAAGASARAT